MICHRGLIRKKTLLVYTRLAPSSRRRHLRSCVSLIMCKGFETVCPRPLVAKQSRARGDHSMRVFVALALCALLTGCGTKYQEMGFTGVVAAEQVTADTWRIKARGNAYTGSSTVQDFVLLKAAETTVAAGGTHFMLISSSDASRSGVIVSPGQSTTTFSGNQAFTVTTPGDASQYIKPGQDTYIRVVKGTQPGALSAAEVIQFTGARVKRG